MNIKGFAPIITIILIALVLAAGVFLYLASKSPAPTSPTGNTSATSNPMPSASSTISDWKTYTSQKWAWGYQVEIPKSWFAIEDPDGGTSVTISATSSSISNDSALFQDEVNINVFVNAKNQDAVTASSSRQNQVVAGRSAIWKDLTVGGLPARELTTSEFRTVYIFRGDDTYEIARAETQSTSSQNEFDHIIATFKFIPKADAEMYKNSEYGFTLSLPLDWQGFSVRKEQVAMFGLTSSTGEGIIDHATEVIFRNPNWTKQKPYEDIPIMVFTPAQWKLVGGENPAASVSAAPFSPALLGQNNTYVFAIPPRYNYDFAARFKDVEVIVQTLQGFN
jgi:hypothetical protein